MMKINYCANCGSEDIYKSVKAAGSFICGGCAARFSAVPEHITVTEDGTPENDLRLGLLFLADGKNRAAEDYLNSAKEGGIALAGRVLALLKESAPAEEKSAPVSAEKDPAAAKHDERTDFNNKRKKLYSSGFNLLKKNRNKAVELLTEASDMGHYAASFKLGLIFEQNGMIGEAMLRYRMAADKIYSANERLAALYIRYGKPEEAESLLLRSADTGRASSLRALGALYASQNRTRMAEEFYELAKGFERSYAEFPKAV